MGEYTPTKRWSEIKDLTLNQLAQHNCVEVVNDGGGIIGEFGVFLMVPKTDYIRNVMDTRGQLSNAFWVPPKPEPEPAPLYVPDPKSKPKRKSRARNKR